MIGIGVATAAAGIIVGTITLTGIGQVMTEFVELISGGSLMLMLIFTAVICLILGMGLPTTANYIVVSSLMAPVIVNLGAASGLIVPLIAVHLFVFYFRHSCRRYATGRARRVRGGCDLGGRPDQDRYPGLHLRYSHRNSAVHVHLQHPVADDRHR